MKSRKEEIMNTTTFDEIKAAMPKDRKNTVADDNGNGRH